VFQVPRRNLDFHMVLGLERVNALDFEDPTQVLHVVLV
jgi:hypothetical protein